LRYALPFRNRARVDLNSFCNYNNMIKITYDSGKDATNTSKHGVSLSLARKIDWDSIDASPDHRRDYCEERYVAAAPINGRLYVVVFVIRDDTLRIISLRKANKREVQHYDDKA
jgi:uncharacterized DUF497 family protein